MIIKGTSRAGPGALALHLGNAETNEVVTILETKNLAKEDLRGALIEMQAFADGTGIKKPLYHASISPELPHRLTEEQRNEAFEALEQKMGLTDHSRIIVLHEKEGREHYHIVWSRLDPDTQELAHDGFNYRKHEEVARDLERRFGHDRIQGAFAEREGKDRPQRSPSRAELRQEERTGIKGKDVREEVTSIFKQSDGPEAFRAALSDKGYTLAKGDRRDFVILDQKGGIHSLARRIEGIKAEGLREFMGPLDRESIPNIEEAKKLIAEKQFDKSMAEEYGLTPEQVKKLEEMYGHGADYVSQTMAALKEHSYRQMRLNNEFFKNKSSEEIDEPSLEKEKKDEEYDDKKRAEEAEETLETTQENSNYLKSTPVDHLEISDELMTKLEGYFNNQESNTKTQGNTPSKSGGRGGRKM